MELWESDGARQMDICTPTIHTPSTLLLLLTLRKLFHLGGDDKQKAGMHVYCRYAVDMSPVTEISVKKSRLGRYWCMQELPLSYPP